MDYPQFAMSVPDNEAAPARKELTVDAASAGMRLDQWLASALGAEFSRNRVQSLIRKGAVEVGKATVIEPKHRMTAGDTVTVDLPEPEPPEPQAEAIPLAILFEDDDIIVVDKPAGLVVHPGAGNWTGTLVNALLHHCGDTLSGIGGVRRPGIVHRLDKDTSGVMVVAKTEHAHRCLSAAFADHGRGSGLERAYEAFVWGAPAHAAGTIDAPLGRAADRIRRAVVSPGRSDARAAVTHWRVEERFGVHAGESALAARLSCRLETGRTHQIRVHLAHIGHPLIGDPDYGRGFRTKAARLPAAARPVVEAFPRQALHARLLAFRHPVTGQPLRFETPLPLDMQELLDVLKLC
jgi:23S rRNA pseudouridine1911/1915/1917 synthase